jgi:nanoRNase/pAp phosphatase (c-di-AMP/oligoRNAs hydrolase)
MDIIHRALENRETIENFSIAGIGYVRAEDRDAIPQAADFLMSEENVHTAIVYGLIANGDQVESLVGSMRTSKFTLDPDQFLKDALGKGEDGQYYGGGRPLAGGFTIPVGFLSGGPGGEHQKLKWVVYDAQIKHKIYAKIGVDPQASKARDVIHKPSG